MIIKGEEIVELETITITKERFDILLDKEFKLDCLENGGVDLWEHYSPAMRPYWESQLDDE